MSEATLAALGAGALYALVWALVFVESGVLVAFFLPGDTVLFAAGLVAARGDSHVSVALLASGTVVAACAGNGLGYWSGRRLGRPWLERRTARVHDHLVRAEALSTRFGAGALVAARFVPWARTFVPVLAGVTRMSYPKVAAATLVGALVWGAGIILLGFGAHSIPVLRQVATTVAVLAVAFSVVMPVMAAIRARRSRRP